MPRHEMPNGLTFVTYQDNPEKEVYGWLERNHQMLSNTGGWWLTKDELEAARRAKLMLEAGWYPNYPGPTQEQCDAPAVRG